MIRVLIADSVPMVREGLKQVLAQDSKIAVTSEADSAAGAREKIAEKNANLLILDLELDGAVGLDLCKEIRNEYPDISILVFATKGEQAYALRALKSGASAFLTKKAEAEEILAAVKKIANGDLYVTPMQASKIADHSINQDFSSVLHLLSDRELEVLHLLGTGLSNSEIARKLYLSEKTVSTYRSRMLQKLGLKNNTELIRYAMEHELD